MARQRKKLGVVGLSLLLVAVVGGGLLFIGAVSGWFEQKVTLDEEYNCEDDCKSFVEVDVEGYENMIKEGKSFVLLVDQGGCKTADRTRMNIGEWAARNQKRVNRMMFSEVKESSLHNDVKYYPSVVVVGKGRVKAFLRADADADADAYNNYDDLANWLDGLVEH